MVLYPNKLPESERVCSGICTRYFVNYEKIAVDGAGCCHADSGLWK